MHRWLVPLICLAAVPLFAQQSADPLARRADLGAAIRPPSRTAPATVVRVTEGSALARAGLRAGDIVRSIDGHRLTDAVEFDRRIAELRGGRSVRVDAVRDGQPLTITAVLAPLPREYIRGVEIQYSHVANGSLRQRAILTRPNGTSGRLPAILFVPWLSCDSTEAPGAPSPGIDLLLHRVAAESGWAMLRVDKPGVGDSEGTCADTDLDTEIAGSRAALQWLRQHPWVDASRIVIMGQSFSGAFLPLVAGQAPVAGYIFVNSWSRTWLERLIEFERLRLEASNLRPGEVSAQVRQLTEFYTMFLQQQMTPADVVKQRPALAGIWNDEPGHQYGRSARFHHQLQAIDPGSAWERVSVPTLVMWSDADIVMHRSDHERVVSMVNNNRAGAASLVVVPGGDHGLAARGADGKTFLPEIAVTSIVEFLKRM